MEEILKKNHTKIINLKYQLQLGMKNLNYLMDYIMYQKFKILLGILKKHQTVTANPSFRIYVSKIENSVTYKIKAGYYFKILMSETMKLFGGTKSEITKDENGKNVPHLEITEVVVIHFNIVNNVYQQDSRV